MTLDDYFTVPSPHCGRIDDHLGHEHTVRGITYFCPGPPRGSTPYLSPLETR